MKHILLLGLFSSLLASDKLIPTKYRSAIDLIVAHEEGPIKITVILETKTYPRDNLIDVRLKILDNKKLIAQRSLELFW
jgi:hypothetical protein